ncbi:MAG: flagellar basal body L-ring protein FlgH, partial [Rhodospirillales bacterium]|nr:flagellar basal body L-ring protein FlgH [Rhodospirillales bacterium]
MARPDYKPVSLPMPAPQVAEDNPNSLWRAGAKAFFKDHRAKDIGDLVTVKLALADSAKLENKTERERDDSEKTSVSSLLGLEAEFAKKLPQAVNPASLIDFANKHETSGDGEIDRKETINLTFAAVVTQILPNGSMVIVGRQEIRVNAELRELMVTGVVRPSDIESDNTISHEKIAEMRVAYGGRGTLSQIQQPRWGTQIWDIIFPF